MFDILSYESQEFPWQHFFYSRSNYKEVLFFDVFFLTLPRAANDLKAIIYHQFLKLEMWVFFFFFKSFLPSPSSRCSWCLDVVEQRQHKAGHLEGIFFPPILTSVFSIYTVEFAIINLLSISYSHKTWVHCLSWFFNLSVTTLTFFPILPASDSTTESWSDHRLWSYFLEPWWKSTAHRKRFIRYLCCSSQLLTYWRLQQW